VVYFNEKLSEHSLNYLIYDNKLYDLVRVLERLDNIIFALKNLLYILIMNL
jgi:hypothetical protein